MSNERFYVQYLELCKRTNTTPNKDDFYGYLYGIANNAPAMTKPDYSIMYCQL